MSTGRADSGLIASPPPLPLGFELGGPIVKDKLFFFLNYEKLDRTAPQDFGPAGSSYYYSRTRMAASGDVTLGDVSFAVEGTAWFDHQWGDFIAVGGGGWDWFAINLEDEITGPMLKLFEDNKINTIPTNRRDGIAKSA